MIEAKTARRGLALVFTTLLLDIIGIGIIMPVLPAYLQELTGVGVSEAAIEGGWLFFVYAAMQFLFAPLVGNLSDRFGRRPILLASVLTFAIDNLICAVAWSYSVLFIGRVLAGISGASYSTASAFIADVTHQREQGEEFRPARHRLRRRFRHRPGAGRVAWRIRAARAVLGRGGACSDELHRSAGSSCRKRWSSITGAASNGAAPILSAP